MDKPTSETQSTQKQTLVLRIYFALMVLGGLLTVKYLLRFPTESKNAIVWGLSKERLTMVALVSIVILVAFGMLLVSWVRKPFFNRFQSKIAATLQNKNTWGSVILVCTLGLLGGSYLGLLTPEIQEPFAQAYFERLQPLMLWFTLLCSQTLVVLPLLRDGWNFDHLKPKMHLAYQIVITFGVLLVLWLLVGLTGLGVTAVDAGGGWYYLGAPVMETQAFLAWVLGIFYLLLALWGEDHPDFLKKVRQIKILRADLLLSLLLWLVAFVSWNSTPLLDNWFVAPPRAPNEAFYPNSDASLYDTTGQSLLTGVGFKTHDAPFAIRPMYAFFLAMLHAIAGVDYEPIIWMQIAVLALIPVLLYWITRQLHNRLSAVIAAALLIFRETNAIIVGNSITTAHAKLLMSDLPTTLGVLLFVLIMIRWLQNPAQRQTLALVAGGITGTFMLIRPEFGVLLPFVGFAALLQLIHQPKTWFKGMILIAVGVILVLAPWIWRNYQITGTIFLDSPFYRTDLLVRRYNEYDQPATAAPSEAEGTEEPAVTTTPGQPQPKPTPIDRFLPGESSEEFAERMAQEAANYAKNHPGAVLYFIANHFFNSQVQTVLYLPATWRLPDSAIAFLGHKDVQKFWQECCSTDNYIRRLPFWFKWDGALPRQSILFVFVNLLLIAVGIANAWKQQRFIGLLPLAASLGYTLINAAVRNSGGRYILPVDWIGMLYYAIGLGQVTLWGWNYFSKRAIPPEVTAELQIQPEEADRSLWRAANLWVAGTLLLWGSLLPLSEKIVPEHYPPELLASRYEALLQSAILSSEDEQAILDLVESGGVVVQGRALYPRFHKASEGEAGDSIQAFMPAPYPKVTFYLVGPLNQGIRLPQESAPATFPNGSDVVVIGCPDNKTMEALGVAVYGEDGNLIDVLIREPLPESSACPLPAP